MTPGSKTSEFWVIVASIAITVLNQKMGLGLTDADVEKLMALAIAYAGGRSAYKAAAHFKKETKDDA